MCRVTGVARNTIEVVFGSVELGLILARDVAGHASRRIVGGIRTEGKDESPRRFNLRVIPFTVLHSFHVRFARTVAGLAAGSIRNARGRCLGVNRLRELVSLRYVTFKANLNSGEVLLLACRWFPRDAEIFIRAGLPLRERKTQRGR